MIRSFVFSDSKLVGSDLEREALRLVRADKGLLLWVDLDNPTDDEIKFVLEGVFQFHPLAIEDCVAPIPCPRSRTTRTTSSLSPTRLISRARTSSTPPNSTCSSARTTW
jgi:Mg2+ and Co2+ transporter CorA